MNSTSILNPAFDQKQPIDLLESDKTAKMTIVDKRIKNCISKEINKEVNLEQVEKTLARRNSEQTKNVRSSGEFKITTRNSPVPSPRVSLGKEFVVKNNNDHKTSSLGKETFELI